MIQSTKKYIIANVRTDNEARETEKVLSEANVLIHFNVFFYTFKKVDLY